MRNRLRVLALATAAFVGSPLTAAAAAEDLVLSNLHVDAGHRSLEVTVTAPNLPPEAGLDPASLVATIDGRQVPSSAAVASTTTTLETPRVLLVVDTSGSMLGQPMTDAKQALSMFVADTPSDVELGLMGFSTSPQLLIAPTTDRSRLLGAIAGLTAQGETSLYDAVAAGVQALGDQGNRRLVVLSDGGDTRSRASLEAVLAETESSGVVVDAIGFNTDESVADVLSQITASGRGQVHLAQSAAQLSAALTSAVREQARELTVSVLVPDDLRGSQALSLTVSSSKGALSSATPVSLRAASAAAPSDDGWWGTRDSLLTGLAALAAALTVGVLALLGGSRRDKRKVQSVLDRFTTAPVADSADEKTASAVTRTALVVADKVATSRNLQDKLSLRLDRAAVAMTPAEWLLLRAGLTFGALFVLVVLGTGAVTSLLLAAFVGTTLPSMYLRFKGSRRQKAFDEKLPDALQMTAGSLSAGYSLAQALDGLVREGSEPMATEIGRALAESRLGVPVESTLDAVADRMDSRDFRWVVMAIRVQREVGGNLAGVLTTVSATMRERSMLRRHVRGLAAEGKLSAYILIGLPISLTLFMLTARGEYLRPMYTTGLGIAMIVVALVLLFIGSFWMSRMVKVEV